MNIRLNNWKVNDVERQVLASMTDAMRYPAASVRELYKHRLEIKLGFLETKQFSLGALGRRSKLQELVVQELWRIMLSYRLIRYRMVKMAFRVKGYYLPYQLSCSGSVSEILRLLIGQPWASAGAIRGHLKLFTATQRC